MHDEVESTLQKKERMIMNSIIVKTDFNLQGKETYAIWFSPPMDSFHLLNRTKTYGKSEVSLSFNLLFQEGLEFFNNIACRELR